jgi:uncharacterized protein (DUF433 family)
MLARQGRVGPGCDTVTEVAAVPEEIAEGITIDPKVMVGKPVIKGTRMPVELVLAKLAADPRLDEFFLDYPELTLEQVWACLQYASKLVQNVEHPLRSRALSDASHARR